MSLVIDYAWAHPDPASIRAAGFVGVMRYVSRDASKSITAVERDALHAQGLGIGLVFEDDARRAMKGAPAGTEDGTFFNARATALGWPLSEPLFYAIDFDVQPNELPTVLAYLVAAGKTGRTAHGYGSEKLLQFLMANGISGDWQTCAWSHGVVDNKAALYQRTTHTTPLQGSYDENVVLDPLQSGLWFLDQAPPTPPAPTYPAPTEDIMDRLYKKPGTAAAYALAAGGRVWVDGLWYGIAGKPPIFELPDTSNFWTLPVIGSDAP